MTEDVFTREDMRRLALADDLENLILMMASSEPVQHLALAAQLYKHSRHLNRSAKRMRATATEPEHRELADAMRTAARGAEVAFDAALNATWQLYWVGSACTCEQHVQFRRRQQAEHN